MEDCIHTSRASAKKRFMVAIEFCLWHIFSTKTPESWLYPAGSGRRTSLPLCHYLCSYKEGAFWNVGRIALLLQQSRRTGID